MFWYDVLGNYVTAQEAYAQYLRECFDNGRTLAQWIRDTANELFPGDPLTEAEAEEAARDLLDNWEQIVLNAVIPTVS